MVRIVLLVVVLFTASYSTHVSAQPTLDCRHSIGPPGNWCPKCANFPNYLWARRAGTTSCIRCYTGCQIETSAPDPTSQYLVDLSGQASEKQLQCELAQPFTLVDVDIDSLVTLDSDSATVHRLAQEFPIAAAFVAVLDTATDPMSMLVPESEFQVSFKNRPVPLTAIQYLTGFEQTGRDAYAHLLPPDQDVLTTATTTRLGDGRVLMTVSSELRQLGAESRRIEGPVQVLLRETGARSAVEVRGHGKLRVKVLAVEGFEGSTASS